MMRRAPDELHCPRTGTPLILRRAWPRDHEHLLCEYAAPDGARVAGQWFADPRRLRAVAARTPGDVTILEADGVLLQPGGADRRLPALRALTGAPDAELVAHRPERRAVVRRPVGERATYAKVVRPGRAAKLAERAAHAAAAARGAFRTPALRSFDDAHGIVVWDELAGRSLFALGSTPQAVEGWQRAGEAIACLHDGPTAGVPTHHARDELALTQRWLSHAAGFGLLPPIDVAASLARLLDGAPARIGLLHRDLHDKQLVHQPGAPIGLLDVDTLAVGERALDLANLLAHVELRLRQQRLGTAAAHTARDAVLQAYRPDPATLRRVSAYATASRLRLAAVYAFRPRLRALALELLADAVRTRASRVGGRGDVWRITSARSHRSGPELELDGENGRAVRGDAAFGPVRVAR